MLKENPNPTHNSNGSIKKNQNKAKLPKIKRINQTKYDQESRKLPKDKKMYLDSKDNSFREVNNQVYPQKNQHYSQEETNNFLKDILDFALSMDQQNNIKQASMFNIVHQLRRMEKQQQKNIETMNNRPVIFQKSSRMISKCFSMNLLGLLNSGGGFLVIELSKKEEKQVLNKKLTSFKFQEPVSCKQFFMEAFYQQGNNHLSMVIYIQPLRFDKFPYFSISSRKNQKPCFYCFDQQNQLKAIKGQYLYQLIHSFYKKKNQRQIIDPSFLVKSDYDHDITLKPIYEINKMKFQHGALLKINSIDQEYKIIPCIEDILKDYKIKYSLVNRYSLPNSGKKILMLSFDEKFEVILNILKKNVDSKVQKVLRLINISKYLQIEDDTKTVDERKFDEQFKELFKEKPQCKIEINKKKKRKRIVYKFHENQQAYFGFVFAAYFDLNGKFVNSKFYEEFGV